MFMKRSVVIGAQKLQKQSHLYNTQKWNNFFVIVLNVCFMNNIFIYVVLKVYFLYLL